MICIAGKNEIAVYALDLILDKGISKKNIVALTNNTDQGHHGWQPSFKKNCKDKGIKIVELADLYDQKDLIFISLEFDQIIQTRKFNSKKLYNIHFSLLPAYKGMYTSIMPIINGERHSGVTLHKIDDGIDTGEIIEQTKFKLDFRVTGLELYHQYLKHSKELLYKNIDQLLNTTPPSNAQAAIGASYFSKKTIDFNSISIDFRKTSFEVLNFINAFSFRPYQLINFNEYCITRCIPTKTRSSEKPGHLIKEDYYSIEIATIDYNVVLLKDRLTEILEASARNDIEKIKGFHKYNYSFIDKNEKGWDALIVACYNGSFEIVKYLVENNLSDLNVANNNGTSALMYAMTNASETNNTNLLSYLINQKIDIKKVDYKENDIFYYAEKYGNKKVINLLTKYK